MNADEQKISKRIDALEAEIQGLDSTIADLYTRLDGLLAFFAWEQNWLDVKKPHDYSSAMVQITNNCEVP